jgi:hypothetical protein
MSGSQHKPLFRSEEGRRRFVSRLGKSEHLYGVQLYAYVLMSNHFHLLASLNAEIKP